SDGSLVGKRLLERRPVLRPLNLDPGKLVISFRVASFDRHRKFVARLHLIAGLLEIRQGDDALDFVADIEKNRFAGDGNYGALQSMAATFLRAMCMRLLILREDVAKRLVGLVVGLGIRT